MNILDPFLFAPGDYTIYDAIIFEMSVRKLLDEAGYRQEAFDSHINMLPTLKGVTSYYHESNFGVVLDFVIATLKYLGFRIIQRKRNVKDRLAIKLPRAVSEEVTVQGYFDDDVYVETELINKTVFIRFDDDSFYHWMGLISVVEYFIKIKELIGHADLERYRRKRVINDSCEERTISARAFRRRRRWSYRERRAA